MHPYNFNEMFILALVALSIVGIVCLGLLAVLAIFVLGQKREGEQKENPLITTTEMPEKNILDKLDNILKEMRKSSALTNASFGLAVTFFVVSSFAVIATKPLMLIIGLFLLLLSLGWSVWNFGKWAKLRK
jgi:hypothetical protein